MALERAVIAGRARCKRAGGQALAGRSADHLRALLRDVICGHLAADLPALADELLAAPRAGRGVQRSAPSESRRAEPVAGAEPVRA